MPKSSVMGVVMTDIVGERVEVTTERMAKVEERERFM